MFKAAAFIRRGWLTTKSYRFSLLLQFLGIFFTACSFYFVAKLVGSGQNPYLQPFGGDYMSFLIIGILFQNFIFFALTSFSGAIREEQQMGTLEQMLMSDTPLPLILVYAALWSFTWTCITTGVMLLVSVAVFGVNLKVSFLASGLVLILSILSVSGIGMISAGIVMVVKKGDPVTWLVGSLTGLLSGVFYPVAVLPDFLQNFSNLLPMTHALTALRLTLLNSASFSEIGYEIAILVLFCLFTLPLGLGIFWFGFNRARMDGSLAYY